MPQELGHASAAWQTYQQGRKSPNTRQAGPEFADTTYDLFWIGYTLARQFSRRSATIEARHRALFCSSCSARAHPRGPKSKVVALGRPRMPGDHGRQHDYQVLDLSRLNSAYGRSNHAFDGAGVP
jgi:hypothetical protein